MRLTPELRARIIEMKLAKACSVDIKEKLGVSSGHIEVTWGAYRKANPGAAKVGTGTHAYRRIGKAA